MNVRGVPAACQWPNAASRRRLCGKGVVATHPGRTAETAAGTAWRWRNARNRHGRQWHAAEPGCADDALRWSGGFQPGGAWSEASGMRARLRGHVFISG